MQSLYDDAVAAGATLHLNTVVEEVKWQRNQVRGGSGWAGGTCADRLSLEREDALLDHAFESLSHIFRTSKSFLEQSLVEFTRITGTKIRFQRAPTATFRSADTVVAATGRHVVLRRRGHKHGGHHGTVHGAIATGLRAAGEILALKAKL